MNWQAGKNCVVDIMICEVSTALTRLSDKKSLARAARMIKKQQDKMDGASKRHPLIGRKSKLDGILEDPDHVDPKPCYRKVGVPRPLHVKDESKDESKEEFELIKVPKTPAHKSRSLKA